MSPDAWVVIIGAAGAQVTMILQAWRTGKAVRSTAEAVGQPNGLGPIHDALHAISEKLDCVSTRLDDHIGHS